MKDRTGEERHEHEHSVKEATLMKVLGVISATAMFLLLGAVTPAFAQEEHHEEAAKPAEHQEAAKPAKQEAAKPAKQEQAKPAKQQEQAKSEKQQPAAKPAKQTQQAKTEKQQPQAKPVKQEENGKAAAQQHGQPQRSAEAQQRQRSAPALRLSARGNGRIPDDRFRANFGAEHVFVINQPVIVGGFSRFQYGGFWFGFENPWPEGWYYTDNVYVDYIDGGYYLCNPYYPGVHVGISVVI
jgi:cytoskeletal protein RodZ